MQDGEVDAVDRRPGGLRRRSRGRRGRDRGARPRSRSTPIRRASSSRVRSTRSVGSVLGVVNLGGRPPMVVPSPQTVQTENLNFISYFVPSILALSVMQVGIFAAVPLVADREKVILKRLSATPLRRWQLVGSNTLMRLLIALVQTVIIVGVGVAVLRRRDQRLARCSTAVFVALGAVSFLALGYVLASFTKTEEAANGITQVVQFPMMFLSGVVLPDRGDAAVPPVDRPADPADLPGRCAAPGHGRWRRRSRRCGSAPRSCSAGWSSASRSPSRKFHWQ